MSCLRSLPSEVQGIRFSHLGHAVDPQRVLCSPSQHLHLTQWDNRRDRALGSQNGKTTLSFCLWLQLALTQVKSISPVKPVTTARQAALLHLVIPALFPIILSFEFPIKKSHIPGYVRLPHGDMLFCPSCPSSAPQMSQWKTSISSHSLTINKSQKVKRRIFKNVKNKGSFKKAQVYTSGVVYFQAES